MAILYFEKSFFLEEEVKIPYTDRGFQIGDGAFSVVQIRDGIPLFLKPHLDLLEEQCRAFNLTMPLVTRDLVEELIEKNQAHQGIWRLKIIVSGGDSEERRLPQRSARLLMVCKPFEPSAFKPLKVGLFSSPYHCCHASFKSLSHLNRYYVMEEAHHRNLDDCVTLTESGFLLEAAFGNLFWVIENAFFTPDPSLPLYFGVTIQKTVETAKNLGFEIHKVRVTPCALPERAALFRTNTMQGLRPITELGGRSFARHPILEPLFLNSYQELIQKESHLLCSP